MLLEQKILTELLHYKKILLPMIVNFQLKFTDIEFPKLEAGCTDNYGKLETALDYGN